MSQVHGKQIKDTSVLLNKINPATGQTLTLVGTSKIQQPQAPLVGDDLANKTYVDSVAAGLDPKEAVNLATTGNISGTYNNGTAGVGATLVGTPALSIDGVTITAGERILVKDQTNTFENGIYDVTTDGANWVLTRAVDFDGDPGNEVNGGEFTFVMAGSTLADTGWVVSSPSGVDATIGTTPILWVQFSSAGVITAGAGLYQDGNSFNIGAADESLTIGATQTSVNTDGSTIQTGASGIEVIDGGITSTQINSSVAGAGLTGGSGTALAVNVDNGLSIVSDVVELGGTVAKNTDITVDGGVQLNIFATNSSVVWIGDDGENHGLFIDDQAEIIGSVDTQMEFTNSDGDFLFTLGGSGLATISDGRATTRGLEYQADYSADFTNRTLVDKEYVDNAIGSVPTGDITGVTAGAGLTGGGASGYVTLDVNTDNGLSIVSDVVELGGTLTKDTTIDGDSGSYEFNVLNSSTVAIGTSASFSGAGVNLSEGYTLLHDYSSNPQIELGTNDSYLDLTDTAFDISVGGPRTYSLNISESQQLIKMGMGDATNRFILQRNDTAIVTGANSGTSSAGMFLNVNSGTISAGIVNAVVVAGTNINATQSNTLNTSNFLLHGGLSKYTIQPDTLGGFDDLTMVTKKYVDDAIALIPSGDITGVTAGAGLTGGGASGYVTLDVNTSNGLSIVSDVVELGGTLTKPTTISQAGNTMSFVGGNITIDSTGFNGVRSDDANGMRLDFGDGTGNDYISNLNYRNSLYMAASYSGVYRDTTGSFNQFSYFEAGEDSPAFSGGYAVMGVDRLPSGAARNTIVVQEESMTIEDNSTTAAGIEYAADYSTNYSNRSLVDKEYVDNAVASTPTGDVTGVTAGAGLSGGGNTGFLQMDIELTNNGGLTFSASGDGGTLEADYSSLSSALAGDGLIQNGSVIDVQVGDGLAIVSDTVEASLVVNSGLTFSGGAFDVSLGTGLSIDSGDIITDSSLSLLTGDLPNTSVATGSSIQTALEALDTQIGNLEVSENVSVDLSPLAAANFTSGINVVSATTLASDSDGEAWVYVNGVQQVVGTATASAWFWSDDGGSTARANKKPLSGDQLIVNIDTLGYSISGSNNDDDIIEVKYDALS